VRQYLLVGAADEGKGMKNQGGEAKICTTNNALSHFLGG